MADFRRWFIALAVLALVAGLANAQIGIAGSTTAGPLTCTANGASIPQIRSEGYTELLGDILINCSGGPVAGSGGIPAVGSATPIPTTNITVFIQPATGVITSRLFSSGSSGVQPTGTLSEIALLIDEPGSGLTAGVSGFGPNAPQVLCAAGPLGGGCPAYVSSSGGYEVAASTVGGSSTAANIYQGYINAVGTNTVTFYGVPVLPPVTSGVTRTFRITNIRTPGVGYAVPFQIQANLSTSPSQVLPLTQSLFPVGVVLNSLTSKAVAPTFYYQCLPQSGSLSSILSFTEGFATAFKTRVVPLTNTTWAAESPNTGLQNIPGGLYGGFASNSESGFIVPGDISGSYTAGLADFGTRLKAVFTNIPVGITLLVTTTSTNSNGTSVTVPVNPGGTTLSSSYAVLVASETTSDGTAFAPFSTATPLATVPLTANATTGQATAVWEVTNSQPASIDTLYFGVYIAYKASAATTSGPGFPYGLPQITGLAGAPVNNVSLSYAPEPSQLAFSASAASFPGTNIIPRFSVLTPSNWPWVNIGLCQTTLLYPFVTANPSGALGQGFDTGIAIANTSMDPFGTAGLIANPTTALNEAGSCTLYPYGVTLNTAGATSAPPKALPGCDAIGTPFPGTNCFPIVSSGSVQTVSTNTIWPGFQGYVIAICNFQYAHGYAAVTDLGLRGLFSSYLALELAPDCVPSTGPTTNGGSGSQVCAGRGVSIEQLVH